MDQSSQINIPEPKPEWYSQGGGFFGNKYTHNIASTIYALVALAPALWFVFCGELPETYGICMCLIKFAAFGWALFVSVGYPIWSWLETREFEEWVRSLQDEGARERERAYYSLMREHSKSFWAGFLAIYTIAGLWGVVLKSL